MCGVAEQEQRTELHGLRHHTAQGCQAAIDDLAGFQRRMIVTGATSGELGPDRLVAPVREAGIGGDLEILSAQVWSTHAVDRQSVRVGAVHALLGDRCGVRQNAQPGKRIRAFKGFDVRRHRRAPDAVEAVARRDHVGVDVVPDTVDGELDRRCAALEIVYGYVVGGREEGFASDLTESVDEVGDDLGLPIDVGVARRQSMEVEVVRGAIEADIEPLVYQRLTMEPFGYPEFGENVDGRILDDTCTHTRANVVLGLTFEHHGVDPLAGEHVRQREPRGACADDRDLSSSRMVPCGRRSHNSPLFSLM